MNPIIRALLPSNGHQLWFTSFINSHHRSAIAAASFEFGREDDYPTSYSMSMMFDGGSLDLNEFVAVDGVQGEIIKVSH